MPYPAIDGNVYRVLSRCFGIDDPIDTAAGKRIFKELSQELIDINQPDIYNQGMMSLGHYIVRQISPLFYLSFFISLYCFR